MALELPKFPPGAPWCHGKFYLKGLAAWCRRPAAPHHQPAGRFFKFAPGPFWDPRVVKIGFLAKRYADFTYVHDVSNDFFENHDF